MGGGEGLRQPECSKHGRGCLQLRRANTLAWGLGSRGRKEGKGRGGNGLYSRGCGAVIRGFNREDLRDEFTGSFQMGKNTDIMGDVIISFLFPFYFPVKSPA